MSLSKNQFDDLVSQISHRLKSKRPVFVAISGFGGSGKSRLADQLKQHFQINDSQIIRLDNLYSQTPDGPGILDQVNWPLLKKILTEACTGKKLTYVGKGFRGEPITIDEELPDVVIVEGIRLLQPSLQHFFDISIWIDCPQSIALERAKARDRAQGEDEETVNRWDTDWGPKDKEYYETYRPDQLASCLYQ